jgi:hypothetical protein
MDVIKILAELREELAQIDAAILSLERLERGAGPRRGRPPRWLTDLRKQEEGKKPAVAAKSGGAGGPGE